MKKLAFLSVLTIIFWIGLVHSENWPDLSLTEPAKGGGEKDSAVVIGVERYGFVTPVPGAKQNASDWYSYFTKTINIPVEKVYLLRDSDATKEEMKKYILKAVSSVEPGGIFWFIFIGHGAPSKDGKDGLLVGVDAQQKIESLNIRSLAQKELLSIISQGKQAMSIILIDACFSGKSPSGKPIVDGLQPLVTISHLF